MPDANVGVAPHSLRAVTPEELRDLVAIAGEGRREVEQLPMLGVNVRQSDEDLRRPLDQLKFHGLFHLPSAGIQRSHDSVGFVALSI